MCIRFNISQIEREDGNIKKCKWQDVLYVILKFSVGLN